MKGRILQPESITRRTLSNGLTAVVRVDRSAPVVAIVTHLRVGYFNEPDELAGISHVLEHMFFKGTPTRGPGVLAQETKAAGGLLNAATIYDYTTYYTILPSSSLDQGMALQADALLNSVIDADELRRELQVIIQEAKRKLDNPSAVAAESLYELMFDVHRMRRWRIGTEAFLNRLTRDQLFDYYRTMYCGPATVLVITGDVDAEETHRKIEQLYSPLENGAQSVDHGPAEPAHQDFRFAEKAGDIVHAHLEIGWHTPATLHDDTAALDLLAVLLGSGRASRLYRGVRERGLVTSISARNYTPTALGVFQISAELEPSNGLPALRAIAEVVCGVQQEIGEEELARARSVLEARMLRRLESMEGQANFLAEWEALGDWEYGEKYLQRIAAVSVEQVRAVAAQYLRIDQASTFFYRPNDADPIGLEAAALRTELTAAQPALPDAVAMIEAPAVVAAPIKRSALEDDVHTFVAPDGTHIYVKPRHSAPLVSIAIGTSGGAHVESVAEAGWTGLVARASVKGTGRRNAYQIALGCEARGASIAPSVSADAADWYVSVPSRHLDATLELLSDVALNPSFPESEVEREKGIALTDLQQVRDDMYRYPLRLFLETAFAGHPYGFSLDHMAAAIERASSSDLRQWHRHTVLAREPAVFIVGDVEPEHAAARAAHYIAHAPFRAAPQQSVTWPASGGERVEQRAKAQTALVLGYPGVDRNHPDLYALQVLANAIAGLGGRLFEELRSKRSLAYTVTAYPIARQFGGAFVTYIATAPEREAEATQGLLDELDRVRQELLSAEDVERAKRYMIGSWHIRSQTNGSQLGDLINAILLGRGLAEIREYEQRVNAVTPEQIRDLAQRYFDDSKIVKSIVRGTGAAR